MNSIALRVLRPLIAAAALLALWPASAFAVLSYPVTAVSFHDANSGFLAGGPGNSGLVSTSSDGGATWHSSIAANRFMYSVAASLDSADAMAVGDFDGARVTSNAGSTWTAEEPLLDRVGTKLHGSAYLSGGRRVAVGKVEAPMDYAVIASAVGAGDWAIDLEGPKYPTPVKDTDPPQTRTNAGLRAVDAAPGETVAWAVGTNFSLNPQSATGEALIYRTTDSGSTWATQTVTGAHAVTSVSAADDNTAFIGCSSKRVLRTLDGGSTWAALSAPTAITINAIDALDANTVVVVGDGGKVSWTTNASAGTPIWTAPITVAGGNNLLGVKVIDATHWVVVGDKETIIRTSDSGTTWAGSTATAAPTVNITAPTAGALLNPSTVAANGTASDGFGVGVASVQIRLQRADGQYWAGGATWSASEAWHLATSTDGWRTWEAALPDASEYGGAVALSARSTDGLGLTGPVLSIDTDAVDTIAPVTTISGGPFGVWTGAPVSFGLSATDEGDSGIAAKKYSLNGASPVDFEGGTVEISAEGVTDISYWSVDNAGNEEEPRNETVRIDMVAPSAPTLIPSATDAATLWWTPSTDSRSGVARYTLHAADGSVVAETSGTQFTVGAVGVYYVTATDVAGNVSLPSNTVLVAQSATAIAPYATSVISGYNAYVAIGGRLTASGSALAGKPVRLLSSTGAYLGATTTGADGGFRFNVKPSSASYYRFSFVGDTGCGASLSAWVKVTPKASIGRPVVPSKVKRSKYFKVYTDLKPKHKVGSVAAKFYFERYQRLRSGKYGWVKSKTVNAKAATRLSWSRCTARLKLAKGKWRVRAMHSDAGHATSYSAWRYFTAR